MNIPKEKCLEELYLFCKISEELTGDELFKLISEYVRCKPDILRLREQWQKVVKAFTSAHIINCTFQEIYSILHSEAFRCRHCCRSEFYILWYYQSDESNNI